MKRPALPPGFSAAGVACGIKPGRATDLAVIYSEREAVAAGVFTTNRVQAAPVRVSREHLRRGRARVIVANSGNANACTGPQGMADAKAMAARAAAGLGIRPQEVLVASTGVIGVPLPMGKVLPGIDAALRRLSRRGLIQAAEGILTTDTRPKVHQIRRRIGGKVVTVTGIAKGAGMIHPHMATMLAFLLTDAAVDPKPLKAALKAAVAATFNRISVDGDQSTNDTVFCLANGLSGHRPIRGAGVGLRAFQETLTEVCLDLAHQIVRDGEGATHFVAVHVTGAPSERAATRVASAVANSVLVKTALFGRDPNWGRVMAAVGRAGVPIRPERIGVAFNGIPLVRSGTGLGAAQRRAAARALTRRHVTLQIHLGMGRAQATVWTTDLSEAYVRLNARYTT